jgi:hypothetical protein
MDEDVSVSLCTDLYNQNWNKIQMFELSSLTDNQYKTLHRDFPDIFQQDRTGKTL